MEMVVVGEVCASVYDRVGDGAPVVLLHRYVGDGRTTWRRQLEGLAGEFTLIAWDTPGAGRSSDPPETLGIAGYADCPPGPSASSVSNGHTWPVFRSVVRWQSKWPVATQPLPEP